MGKLLRVLHRLKLWLSNRPTSYPTLQDQYAELEAIREFIKADIREISLGRLSNEVFHPRHKVRWLSSSSIGEEEAKKIRGEYLTSDLNEVNIRQGETRTCYSAFLNHQGEFALVEMVLSRRHDVVRENAFPIHQYTVRSFSVTSPVEARVILDKCDTLLSDFFASLYRIQEQSAFTKELASKRHRKKRDQIADQLYLLKLRGVPIRI